MKGKVAMVAIALIGVLVGVVFAVQPATQIFPPVRRPIAVHPLCETLSVSPDTPIPEVGQEGVIRFDCQGSAPDCTFNLGHDCAFTAGNGRGGQAGYATPTFTLPTGYTNLWVKGSAIDPLAPSPAEDCGLFDDAQHWLNGDGQHPFLLGNISHSYCAHVDADMPADLLGTLASFTITWS